MAGRIQSGFVPTVLLLAFSAGVAKADHFAGTCAAEFNAVEQAINAAVFLGSRGQTDQSNLLAKLEAASAKVELGKAEDGVDKLQEISDKATALATAPKPKLDDAAAINAAVTGAIGCVAGL